MRLLPKINIKLATSWNQLTERQLGQLAYDLEYYNSKLKIYKDENQVVPQLNLFHKLQLEFIRILLSVNGFIKTWIALRQIPPSEYVPFIQWITSDCTRTIFPEAFKVNGTKVHPPANRLQNVNMKEFSFLDSLFYNWDRTGKEVYLNFLCAALYRPASKTADEDIDIRVSFDKLRAEKSVSGFTKLPIRKKLAIAYAFKGSRNYVAAQYPHVFPKPVEVEEEETEDGKKKGPQPPQEYVPFGKLMHHKVQYDPSKLTEVQHLNIHDFFGSYENELIELKKTNQNGRLQS